MAERKPAKTGTQQSVKSMTGEASKGFTDEERAAMRERAQEVKTAARRDSRAGKTDGESDVLAKIAEMPRYATFGFSDKANLDVTRHVANLLRVEGVDRRRGGKDRRARKESGELRTEPH
jgi:hypothetical protein